MSLELLLNLMKCQLGDRRVNPLFSMFLCLLGWMMLVAFANAKEIHAEKAKACVSCHQQQVNMWQQSDHAKAMSEATPETVLGDFNDATVTHFSQQARFFKENAFFYIELNEAGAKTTYQVAFTFGHYPLQQYLVPAENGRYQVFPFAWDSRPTEDGGQRWYPLYQDEDIQPNDRLHWQQALQNWNGMCADCHSDGLKRQFNISHNYFETQWDNINVGCQSCHGDMLSHATKQPLELAFNPPQKYNKQLLQWLLNPEEDVARLVNEQGKMASHSEKKARQQFMEKCFACHSLRSPLTDGFSADMAYLDQFSPSLLAPPFYHADGQIKEEVYVYGSFLQSKMHDEGVTCLDCHDKHSMKVKVQGNGLCLQCHNAQKYQQPKHIRHAFDSEAGQCVSCHMPETTYMGVDKRRDHSFKVPRPHLSEQYNTPNACVNCHEDKGHEWAAQSLKKWFGAPKALSNNEKQFLALLHQQTLPLDKHLALINSSTVSEIQRASAIMLLPNSTRILTELVIKDWVTSDLPLIRLATARVGHLLLDEDLKLSYQALLDDEYKAIRVAAAEHLIAVKDIEPESLQKAFNELTEANRVNSWRGEGNLNQSLLSVKLGQNAKAIYRLKHSIEVDPYFEAAYVNLLDIYRVEQLLEEEKQLYALALARLPTSAALHFSYGMHLIRAGKKPDAVKAFRNAVKYDAGNPQHAYLYFLALDAVGKTARALQELKQQYSRYQTYELSQLGMSFAQKLNDSQSYFYFANME